MDKELEQTLEEETVSEEIVEEEIAEEVNETEDIENYDEDLEAEVEELTADDEAQPAKKGGKAWIFGIIAVIIAVAVIFGVAISGGSESSDAEKYGDEIVYKVSETEFTLNEFNFMYISLFNELYSNLYNYYGDYISGVIDLTKPLEEQMVNETTSWHQYVVDYTTDTLKNLTGLYNAAVAEGFVLPEEYQTDLDSIEEQLTTVATQSGMTLDEYLDLMYGDGITVDVIKKMTEFRYVAGCYAEEHEKTVEVSEEDINAYYTENKDTIDTVTFRYYSLFYGDSDGGIPKADAEKRANELAAATDKEEFNALAYEYSTDEQKEYFTEGSDPTLFANAGYGNTGIEDVEKWLFDSERKQGETFVYLDEVYSSYLVVMFEARNSADYDLVDVRHILITPVETEEEATEEETPAEGTEETEEAAEETAETEETVDPAWAAAEAKATEILNEYLAGEMTEDAFSALAMKHSEDGNASKGGIYEDVYKGQMVTEFENWCFDPARAVGDTGIVKTQFGYHIMYFVGFGESNLESLVRPTLVNDIMNAWIEELSVNITDEKTDLFEKVGGMIDDIINAANAKATANTATE